MDLFDRSFFAVDHNLELPDISVVLQPVGSSDPRCSGFEHGLVHDLVIGVRPCHVDGFSCIDEGNNEDHIPIVLLLPLRGLNPHLREV